MAKTYHDDSPSVEFSLEEDMIIVPDEFAHWSCSVQNLGNNEFEALEYVDELLRRFEDMPLQVKFILNIKFPPFIAERPVLEMYG